ncbi:MAG: UvrD-helicase domain-containing protein [Bacteroidaceae bacterium]|nr:UvrD-helicase domain-containing protein [Bacteroidaceae bacterium]
MMTPRFLLFRASAGSGKTFNLAMQYIALLVTQGEHEFRHTLAVTFTNKATAEMKDRILLFLHNFWKGEGKPEDFEALKRLLREDYQVELADEDLRERCHRALSAILHDYGHFTVSTIDAFFQSVLRNMAHELGLNARMQVDIADQDVVELAVENLIEGLRHDNRDVLPWLREYIEQQLDEGRAWDVRKVLKQMARMLFEEEYLKRSLDPTNKPFDIGNISHFRKLLTDERDTLTKQLGEAADRFEDILRQHGLDYEEAVNYGKQVRTYVEALRQGNVQANFGKNLEKMTTEPEAILKSNLRKVPAMQPIDQGLSDSLTRLHEAQERIGGRMTGIEVALQNLSPMGLLGAIDKEVTRISNERGRFMLARTPILLKRMVSDDDASFIFERIGTRFRNIMIDEFQDTSRLQWENFRTLLLDNLATGGLSMVVGDIKQSIYRWRSGDWRILHELGTRGHNGTPLTERKLDDNYRSLGHIVDFNSDFFHKAACRLDTLAEAEGFRLEALYDDVRQGVKRDEEGGYVRLRLCHTKDKDVKGTWQEEMLDDLCQQVRMLHEKGLPYEEMAILLRKSRYIEPIIDYFARHMEGVKLVSNEAFLLEASVAVRMIISALQYVADPGRNPVTNCYLMKHYLRDVEHREVVENDFCMAKPEDVLPVELTQGRERLLTQPLYELCETLYRTLRLEEIKNQDAYLMTFFDELALYLRDNPSDIPTLLQFWDDEMHKRAIPNSEVDGIRIFTIHRSKGLAFGTVLMPFANWTIEKDMRDDLTWSTPHEAPLDEMGSLPVKFSSRVKDTAFGHDYLIEHAYRRADELNDLYVAFTRARDNLYVWGLSEMELEQGKYDITVADLMYDVLKGDPTPEQPEAFLYTYGTEPTITATRPKQQRGRNVPMCSYESSLNFRQSHGAEEFAGLQDDGLTDQQRHYINEGKLLHYVFSKIRTADDITPIVTQLGKQGILTDEKRLRRVADLAHRGLRHERVREWFSGNMRLFNECNILVPAPETGHLEKRRPDRVMMSQDRIVVVDFKFGTPRPEHKSQVAEYMRILASMYPTLHVEGWLWYVYKNEVLKVES